MTLRNIAGGLIGALIPLFFTACSTTQAEPADRQTLPPRPASSIMVDTLLRDPCLMLDTSQQARLELRTATAGTATVEGLPTTGCTWLGRSAVDYNSQVIPADAAMATRLPDAEVIQINGYGAVRNIPVDDKGGGPVCQVAIDAAPGQTIRVQALTRTDPPPIPVDQICKRATEVASMVMTTVVATASR